ncbi:MFS transporter [Candidatus Daviesbacteria bacterium]|nr:MFS transporter [Candidatus Daviesbacteria bacterium]
MKKPPLFFIYLTIFVNIIGFGMVFPLLPFYARHFQASEFTVGLLAASFAIAQFILSPVWGRLSDRVGRKPIMAVALLGLSLSFLLFGLANNLFWLFVGRILQGVFSAASISVAQAYVGDVTSKEERIKGMGNLGASLAAGFIFGLGLGGVLSTVSLSFPFFVAAVLAAANFIFVMAFLPESLSKKAEKLMIKEGLFNIKHMYQGLKGELGSFFILTFLWSFALTNNEVAMPLFAEERLALSASTIGYFFSLMGLLSAFMQSVLIYKITRFLGEHKTAVLGIAILAVGLFLIPFAKLPVFLLFFKLPVFLLFFMIVMAVGSSMTRPTLASLVSKETKEGQGTTMGIFASFESLGRVFGPLLGGWLFSNFGFHSPFTVSAILIFITLVFVVQIRGFFKD